MVRNAVPILAQSKMLLQSVLPPSTAKFQDLALSTSAGPMPQLDTYAEVDSLSVSFHLLLVLQYFATKFTYTCMHRAQTPHVSQDRESKTTNKLHRVNTAAKTAESKSEKLDKTDK
eukprot:GHVT01008408.1.p1 GENE.GHVT01008408.1~~GHVT01008408.1.p1  ORF type:complete len:116 (+),score=7.49 GHVT01008408.1:1175-1522(+)